MLPGGFTKPESRAHLTAFLAARSDRCAHGYATAVQDCSGCAPDEWSTFVAALRKSTDAGGLISQTRMRPLISRIPAKHRGLLYRRARRQGLIEFAGKEESTDVAGRNADKEQRRYQWLGTTPTTAAA